jgi:hypothetical protein
VATRAIVYPVSYVIRSNTASSTDPPSRRRVPAAGIGGEALTAPILPAPRPVNSDLEPPTEPPSTFRSSARLGVITSTATLRSSLRPPGNRRRE